MSNLVCHNELNVCLENMINSPDPVIKSVIYVEHISWMLKDLAAAKKGITLQIDGDHLGEFSHWKP